jgi:cysteine desulfurase/selenocysteine lyase
MFDKSEKIFPSKKNMIFLGHCAVSPIYNAAANVMKDFVTDMAANGIAALPRYFDVMPAFHKNAAKLLRTSECNISYVHNTAEALCMIGNGYPFTSGDQVISYIHEYPSNHYPWVLQKSRGVELLLLSDAAPLEGADNIKKPKGWSMAELAERVTERTRIVAISHVQFTSGYAADLRELGAFCKQRDIDLIVDCAQSLGCLPVYPEEYHVSAVVASGWKWLMGPKGSGLLYTSEEFRRKLNVTMAGPGLMQQGLNYLDHDWAPHSDGRFFEYSTLPWDHAAAMNVLFEEIFLRYSIEDIRDEVFRLQDLLMENMDLENLQILRFAKKNRSGILVAEPVGDSRKIVKDLSESGIIITAPIGYLRFAPHFYNSDDQLVETAEKMNAILGRSQPL